MAKSIKQFNEADIDIQEVYKRKGKDCLYDPVREILVPATPEEYVRQKLILWLMESLDIPLSAISSEEHLSHYAKSSKSRADIVVKAAEERVLILAECKRPSVAISHDVVDQAHKYADNINPKPLYIMLTNGQTSIFEMYENGEYVSIQGFSSYKSLLKKEGLKRRLSELERLKPLVNKKYKFFLPAMGQPYVISKYMDDHQAGFVGNLYNCLMNESERMKPHQFKGLKLRADKGLRFTSFGNAGGGIFDGYFRCFLVHDSEMNVQLVSMTICTTMEVENDPKWGNQKEKSYLIVAIDDFKSRHNSLQLNMDKYMEYCGDDFTIWHDGKISIGNIGSGKTSEALAFVKSSYPELVKDDRVILGIINNKKLIHINDNSMTTFIINCIKYALARDEFRKLVKSRKKANS